MTPFLDWCWRHQEPLAMGLGIAAVALLCSHLLMACRNQEGGRR